MTDLQITLAVGGALGVIFGATAALALVWWFQPARLYAAFQIHTQTALHTHPSHQLVARHRTPRLRPTDPTRTRPHRPAHTSPTGILGDLAATHPELAERLLVRYRAAMATRPTH